MALKLSSAYMSRLDGHGTLKPRLAWDMSQHLSAQQVHHAEVAN